METVSWKVAMEYYARTLDVSYEIADEHLRDCIPLTPKVNIDRLLEIINEALEDKE